MLATLFPHSPADTLPLTGRVGEGCAEPVMGPLVRARGTPLPDPPREGEGGPTSASAFGSGR